MSDLKDRVKASRRKIGINQEELGAKIGLTIGAISGIEKGISGNPETIKKIAEVVKVDYNWLLTGEGVTPEGIVLQSKPQTDENPWRDALVMELKEEIKFCRAIISNLTEKNFPKSPKLASAHLRVLHVGAHLGDQLRKVA